MLGNSKKISRLMSAFALFAFGCKLFGNVAEAPGEQPELGAELRSEAGGFSFRPIPEWEVEKEEGIVLLTSPDGDPDTGPKFLLTGGQQQIGVNSNEELLEEFKQPDSGNEYFNQREFEIGGVQGLAADLKGDFEGREVRGRLAVALVSGDQYFQAIGIAPGEKWEEGSRLFEAVMKSVSFFEPAQPIAAADTPTPGLEPVTAAPPIRQWAAEAKASSEYDNPDWAASQATGAPDTGECDDLPSAWASKAERSIEWLELTYSQAVTPSEVIIHQTHSPSQVARVELIDTGGTYYEIYTAEPVLTNCPYVLSIPVQGLKAAVQGVKITIDQTKIDLPWNEIDAVELVGYAISPVAGQPIQATSPPAVIPTSQATATSAGSGTDRGMVEGWSWKVFGIAEGLPEDAIKAVAAAADGTLWVGTASAGIFSLKDGRFTQYGPDEGFKSNTVNAVAIAPDGTVWAGTGQGLARYSGSSWTHYTKTDGLVYDDIKSLATGADGVLWVGSPLGLSRFDGQTWTTYRREEGLVDNYIADIAFDSQGNPWFATFGGIASFDGSNWTSYTEQDGLAYKVVTAVALGLDGVVWAGTSGGGVSRFDGSSWSTYQEADDFDLDYIKAIEVGTDGALWFASEGKGVYRFDGQSWLNFRQADGIPYDWADALAIAPDGTVWIGCRQGGLAHFGP